MSSSSTPSSAPANRPRISVGIGSWTDKEYDGLLFPKGLPPDERLKVYATHFDHVEVNSTLHAQPRRAWVESWVQQTPAGFVFDVKLHKTISNDPEGSVRDGNMVRRMLEMAQPIIDAGKFGAFFAVLLPSFGPKSHRLEELVPLVEKLRPQLLAVELRHRGWVEGEQRERTLEFFRAQQLVWIAVDMPRVEGSTIMPAVDEVTNPKFAYLRLHGRRTDWPKLKTTGERHTYEYSSDDLNEIVARVRTLAAKADHVRVVANNHAEDFAPKAALELKRLLKIAGVVA